MLEWFAETTLVASALAAVAALGGRVRPIGPTARHLLWLAVLVKMMTPPLVAWPWAVAWREPAQSPVPRLSEPVGESPVVTVAADEQRSGTAFIRPAAIETIGLEEPPADTARIPTPIPPADPPATARVTAAEVARGLGVAWLAATVLLAAGQARRIARFRRRLRLAVPGPDDLVAEAERIAGQIGVRAPEILVVPDLGSPMLWCPGRPRLLIPGDLVKTIDRARWRGVLVHELAHLRRGDHWVSRLELIAGLLWWWNPLYWLTRARLDAEAELACDAWVVWALPEDRLAYAETLYFIGSLLSRAAFPAPALGVAGSGRFLERRLTMILHERVPCRISPLVLLAVGLLVLAALPSWSATVVPAAEIKPVPLPAPSLATAVDPNPTAIADDDDDDDDDKQAARAKKAEAKARARAEAKARARVKAKADARAKKADGKKDDVEVEFDFDFDKTFGPEFEKKMEALGKDLEARFGPEFEKKMEALGKDLEARFGPEFEKKMEALGKDLEARFGPEFQKKMEALGKEMEAKFGPGSEFETQMKKLGEDLGKKLGPGSEFEKQMKELGAKVKEKAEGRKKAGADAGTGARAKEQPRGRATARSRRRAARIEALEAQIHKLAKELEALQADGDDEEDEDR